LVVRRPAAALVAALVLIPLVGGLAGCGSGTGQLQVRISSPDAGSSTSAYTPTDPTTFAQYKPGDNATLVITVQNTGPGTLTGVTLHVILPAPFHYRATTSISAPGATRTQPLDPAVNTNAPIFGLWTIAPPGAEGTGQASEVQITFTASVDGQPGGAIVQAFAAGDASAGQTNAAPYNLIVSAAAKLSALVSVNPATEARGGTVIYQVRVTNSGTGNAQDVAVLVTLPPVMTFAGSVTPFAGNGTRNKGVDPIKNTLDVFYDGFLLPPTSNAGLGYVVIVFKANVLGGRAPSSTQAPGGSDQPTPTPTPTTAPSSVPPGTYTVDVQVTDQDGDTFTLHQVAPVAVT
jgi:uncharacterized repeat protein (TIGR01451 family)